MNTKFPIEKTFCYLCGGEAEEIKHIRPKIELYLKMETVSSLSHLLKLSAEQV